MLLLLLKKMFCLNMDQSSMRFDNTSFLSGQMWRFWSVGQAGNQPNLTEMASFRLQVVVASILASAGLCCFCQILSVQFSRALLFFCHICLERNESLQEHWRPLLKTTGSSWDYSPEKNVWGVHLSKCLQNNPVAVVILTSAKEETTKGCYYITVPVWGGGREG